MLGFGNEVAKVLSVMRREKKRYKNYLPEEAIYTGRAMAEQTQYLWKDVRKKIVNLIEEEISYDSPYATVWWYTVLLEIDKEPAVLFRFLRFLRQYRDAFSLNTQCYLYYQLSNILFRYSELNNEDNKVEFQLFYQEVLEEFARELSLVQEEIGSEKRNQNLVLVVTEQFISDKHGPTKTAMDRCKILIEKMGKEVILINSREMLNMEGRIPFCSADIGNHDLSKEKERTQFWKGTEIPYYRCKSDSPDLEEMKDIIEKVRAMMPVWIILIGGGGILGPLLGQLAPSVAIGTVPSELGVTCAKYQTLGRKITEKDIHYLKRIGRTEKNIIEGIFTSSLKEQKEHITKGDLGVSEDSFLISVVGGRLDTEVTDAFLEMLEKTLQGNMYVGFWGGFSEYEMRIKKYPNVQKRSSYFGFCEDILSRMEVCSLYLNPTRKGGGTSCVEAMFQRVPVLTVNYGDVSVNAGEEFCVRDYQEMSEKILKYYSDKEYYLRMSEKAKKRTETLLDTETEFVKIMEEAEHREQKDRERSRQNAGMEAGKSSGSEY